jgi:hypothetical protein
MRVRLMEIEIKRGTAEELVLETTSSGMKREARNGTQNCRGLGRA